MIAFLVPTAAVALLFVLMFSIGGITIMLGRRGKSGDLDYPLGQFTRAANGDEVIDAAHAVVAPRLVLIGLVYLLGGALMLVDQDSTWIAALIIASALISTGLLLLAAVAARKELGAA